MGIVLRQSAKSTIILAIGVLLGALLNYTYTFVFEKPELGFITNIVNQAALAYIFVLMGTASIVVAYAPRFADDDEKRKVLLSISFFFPLITMSIFVLLYIISKERIIGIYKTNDQQYIVKYYYWLPVIIIMWMYTALLEHYLVSKKKAAISTLIREVIHRGCMAVLTVLFFFKKIDFSTFVISMSVSYLIPFLIALAVSIRSGLELSMKFSVFSWQEYRQLIHFSWYHMLEGAAFVMLGYIDSLMLAPLAEEGMSSLSVYRNAIFVTTLMIIPLRAIVASSYAVLNETYIKNEMQKLKDLYSRLNFNIIIIGVLICTLTISNINNLVRIFPDGYEQIKPVVFILLIGKIFQTVSGMSGEVISFSKYYKFNFQISLLLLFMILTLNRILIPKYGIEGAAWGATIAVSVFSIAKTIFLRKKLQLPIIPRHTEYIIIAGIIASIAGIMLPFITHVIPDVIIRSTIVAMLYGGIILRFTPNSDLSQYLKSVIRTRRLF